MSVDQAKVILEAIVQGTQKSGSYSSLKWLDEKVSLLEDRLGHIPDRKSALLLRKKILNIKLDIARLRDE
ncbi:hypothetical protein J4475_00095 [Candidatus Woesearchaeota archaeon]|nr:hypothetical protein [Candidatus Woesearchaeota archaeon]